MLTSRRPLRVAVLCSHRAPGLLDLVGQRLPRTYEIVCVITSEDRFAEQPFAAGCGIPTRAHSIRTFCDRAGVSLYRDFAARAEYDRGSLELLKPYAPDLVLLAGYRYLATEPLLTAYNARLLNLHFSDLTLRLPDGRPRFPGLRAVRDALAAGQPATFATVHFVNAEPDSGTPFVRSWAFPASPLVSAACAYGAGDMFKAYVFAHQEWMLRAASGPLWLAALNLAADGAVDLDALAAADPAAVVPWALDETGGPDRVRPTYVGRALSRLRSPGTDASFGEARQSAAGAKAAGLPQRGQQWTTFGRNATPLSA